MSKTYTGVLLIVGPILTILGYLLMPQNGFGKDPTDPASVVTGMAGNGAQIDIFLLMVALGMAALVGGIYLANRQHAASDKEEDPRTTWGGLITIISFIGFISTVGIIAAISGTTPPNSLCSSIWLEIMFESISPLPLEFSLTIEAAVSSQLVSIPRKVNCFFIYLYFTNS